MTRGCALSKSFFGHYTTATTTCLPFLYQTSTIVRPLRKHLLQSSQPRIRHFAVKKQETDRPRRGGNQKLPSQLAKRSARTLADEEKAESRRKTKAEKHAGPLAEDPPPNKRANAFTEILESQHSKAKAATQSPRRHVVTMTRAEHEIFERLQNISSKKRPIQEKSKSSDLFGEFTNDENLTAMFDDIANTLDKQDLADAERTTLEQQQSVAERLQKEKDAKAKAKGILLQSLQTRDSPSLGSLQPRLPPPGLHTAVTEKINEDRTDQSQEIRELFSKVESDTDLWQLLGRHIFKDMRDLNIVLEAEQKQMTLERKAKKKKDQQDNSLAAVQDLTAIESRPERKLLRKVTNMYGPALLYAARLFRTGFPRSPYAALLLPTIKELGPMSYVLAGSTSFYNELLYIQWVNYRDLNGCASLMEEMISHNILADQRTAVVYEMTSRTRKSDMGKDEQEQEDVSKLKEGSGSRTKVTTSKTERAQTFTQVSPIGSPVKSFIAGWWQLQGTEAGWIRLTKAYDRLVAITRREMQRKRDEQTLADQRARLLVENTVPEDIGTGRSFVGNENTDEGDLEPEIELISAEESLEPDIAVAA